MLDDEHEKHENIQTCSFTLVWDGPWCIRSFTISASPFQAAK